MRILREIFVWLCLVAAFVVLIKEKDVVWFSIFLLWSSVFGIRNEIDARLTEIEKLLNED